MSSQDNAPNRTRESSRDDAARWRPWDSPELEDPPTLAPPSTVRQTPAPESSSSNGLGLSVLSTPINTFPAAAALYLPEPREAKGGWQCSVAECPITAIFAKWENAALHMQTKHTSTPGSAAASKLPEPHHVEDAVSEPYQEEDDVFEPHQEEDDVSEPHQGEDDLPEPRHVKGGWQCAVEGCPSTTVYGQKGNARHHTQKNHGPNAVPTVTRNKYPSDLPEPNQIAGGGWKCAVVGCSNTTVFKLKQTAVQHTREKHIALDLATHNLPEPRQVAGGWQCAVVGCSSTHVFREQQNAQRHTLDRHVVPSIATPDLPEPRLVAGGGWRCAVVECSDGFVYTSVTDAKIHTRAKHGDGLFACHEPGCSRMYMHSQSLTEHKLQVHNTTGMPKGYQNRNRQYDCPESGCTHVSTRTNVLRVHLMNKHGKTQDEIESLMSNVFIAKATAKTNARATATSSLEFSGENGVNAPSGYGQPLGQLAQTTCAADSLLPGLETATKQARRQDSDPPSESDGSANESPKKKRKPDRPANRK